MNKLSRFSKALPRAHDEERPLGLLSPRGSVLGRPACTCCRAPCPRQEASGDSRNATQCSERLSLQPALSHGEQRVGWSPPLPLPVHGETWLCFFPRWSGILPMRRVPGPAQLPAPCERVQTVLLAAGARVSVLNLPFVVFAGAGETPPSQVSTRRHVSGLTLRGAPVTAERKPRQTAAFLAWSCLKHFF